MNGEGSQINVRGLGPQFTRVEINGMTAPGGGGDRLGKNGGGRGFSFELLPSELFSSAAVTKSSEASQSEGGLAGLVSLDTPKPLDHEEGIKFSSSLQGSYSEAPDSIDPRAFFTISNNIDDLFGVSFSLAHSQSKFRTDGVESGAWRSLNTVTGDDVNYAAGTKLGDALIANGTRLYTFLEERDNTAATLALQYRPSETLMLNFDVIYSSLSSEKAAHRNDIPLEHSAIIPIDSSLVIDDRGVVTAGTFDKVQHRVGPRITDLDDTFYQSSFSAEWLPNDQWKITPYIGYSKREADRAMTLLSFKLNDSNGAATSGLMSYKVRGDYVDFNSELTDFSTSPEDFSLNVLIFQPSVDIGDEVTSKLDFTRYFEHENINDVQFGVRYTIRNKEVREQDYRISRTGDPNQAPTLDQTMVTLDFEFTR